MSFGPSTILQFVILMLSASVTEWRSAPGFPFSIMSAAQSCRAR